MRLSTIMRHSTADKKRVTTKCTLQFEAVECGAASLRTILSYYGKFVDLPELRKRCGVTRDGSKASKILKAADFFGLDTEAKRLSLEEFKEEASFPCIVFWNFNHFLVCEGYSSAKFFLSDPAQGRRSVDVEEFADSFTGIYLGFKPSTKFKKGGRDSFPGLFLLRLLAPYKEVIILGLALTLVVSLMNIFVSLSTIVFIDRVLQYNQLDLAPPIVISLLISSGILGVTLILRFFILRRMEIVLSRRFSLSFARQLLEVDYRYYAQRMAGELSSRIANSIDFSHTLVSDIVGYSFSFIQALFSLFAMVLISMPLTIFSAAALILNAVIAIIVSDYREDANKKLSLDLGKAKGVGLFGIKSIQSIKASGRENDFFNRWSGYFVKAAQAQQELGFQVTIISTITSATNFALQLFILSYGGYLILKGNLTLGALIGYIYLLSIFQVPLTALPQSLKSFQQVTGDCGRYLDGLNEPVVKPIVSEVDQSLSTASLSSPPSLPIAAGSVAVKFENVCFGFNEIDPPFFPDLNFEILDGEFVSVIGGSGCGKSTIAKLITQLYRPLHGAITIYENPLESYSSSQAIQLVGYVAQEIFVYSQSFRDNVTLFNPLISDESIFQALEAACLLDLVETSDNGLDTVLRDNGGNLSGGQRQRLEIARALSRSPKILILDEATSALDNHIESKVFGNIRDLGITVINVAHRLQSVAVSDKIISIADGQITDFDTPEKLINRPDSLYARLISSESSN